MNQLDKRLTVETPALSNLTISILRVVRSKFARYSWGISLRGLYGTRAGKGSQLIGFPCANQLRFIAPMAQLGQNRRDPLRKGIKCGLGRVGANSDSEAIRTSGLQRRHNVGVSFRIGRSVGLVECVASLGTELCS